MPQILIMLSSNVKKEAIIRPGGCIYMTEGLIAKKSEAVVIAIPCYRT